MRVATLGTVKGEKNGQSFTWDSRLRRNYYDNNVSRNFLVYRVA